MVNEMNKIEQSGAAPFQRRAMILEYINQYKSASVQQLSEKFFLHEATVRRDLNALAKAGQITRVHGGAAAMDALLSEIPLYVRETAFKEAKREIARKAASLVKDSSTIFVDSSSTAMLMIPFLENKKNLRIATNGVQTALQLSKLPKAQIFSIGGCMRENSLSYAGPIALQNLALFHFDYAFFSCRGATLEGGLSDTSEEEAFLRKLLIQRSDRPVLLLDHSKVGVTSFFGICPLNDVHTLVTDAPLPENWIVDGLNIL